MAVAGCFLPKFVTFRGIRGVLNQIVLTDFTMYLYILNTLM